MARKNTTKVVNPKVTVHIDTTSRDAFAVLATLKRAAKCAYCSADNADEAAALKQFIDSIQASLVTGIVAAAKEM